RPPEDAYEPSRRVSIGLARHYLPSSPSLDPYGTYRVSAFVSISIAPATELRKGIWPTMAAI
ncbi:MAG TPA: hypothetical protein VJ347_03745, partial [Streptosporangiaceae bacterium]|nr:hypothetical protein [Streptosporangiaceae bacterium]